MPNLLNRRQAVSPRKLRVFLSSLADLGSITAACGRARIFRRSMQEWLAEGRKALESGDAELSGRQANTAWLVLMTEQAADRWEAKALGLLNEPAGKLSNARVKSLVFQLEKLKGDVYKASAEFGADNASRLVLALQTRGEETQAIVSIESGRRGSSGDRAQLSSAPARDSLPARGWLHFDSPPPDLIMLPQRRPQPASAPSNGAARPDSPAATALADRLAVATEEEDEADE